MIRVDKSAGSIGGQVNAFHCSSTHYQWRAGIGYLEFALKIQCVLPAFSMRFQREFDKYKNVGGRVGAYIQAAFDVSISLSLAVIHVTEINILLQPLLLNAIPVTSQLFCVC